ncbi:MAG: LmeA family phospholipid-binding protein [Anaerolineae bacterium]
MNRRWTRSRWALVAVLAVAGGLSLACIVPLYGRPRAASLGGPTAVRTATLRPTPSPKHPTAKAGTWRISEAEMNAQLQQLQAQLGNGVDCHDMRAQIRASGIKLAATIRMRDMGVSVPVEVQVMPVVRADKLALDVLDVKLGGPYAAMSEMVKPMLSAGLAQAFDSQALLAQQGVRVTSVELNDGYMTVTTAAVG